MRDEMDQQPPPKPVEANPDDTKPADGAGNDNARSRRRPGAEAGNQPVRQRLEELRRNGPHPQEYETKIWNTLTEGQQKFVQADLDKLREDQRKRQGEEYMRREMEKRRAKEASAAAGGGNAAAPKRLLANPDGSGPTPEMRERAQRIIEKLRQLPPDEREQLLRRFEEELDSRTGNAGNAGSDSKSADDSTASPSALKKKTALDKPGRAGLRGPRPGDEDKTAPGMDDVKVPGSDAKNP
jgi:hypothetical protein